MTKRQTKKRTPRKTPQKRSGSVLDDRLFYPLVMLANPTVSGAPVSEDTAKRFSALFACIKIRSEDLAKIPIEVYRRLPGGGKEQARDHWVSKLLRLRPNRWMTSFQFRRYMVANLDTWGNAYAEKIYDERGKLAELVPFHPSDVQVRFKSDLGVYYLVNDTGGASTKQRVVLRKDMLHIVGFSDNGLVGTSPIGLMREGIGLGLAAETFGAAFFGNGATPASIIEYDKPVNPGQIEALKESIEKLYKGAAKSGRTAILDSGMKWKPIGISGRDAQLMELRRFQVEEIARPYRMPLYKLQDHTHSTFSNVEHLGIEYVGDCLQPTARCFEEACIRDLLNAESESINDYDDELFIEFNFDALLRGDLPTRYAAYATGRQWGWISANDVRGKENMNPIEGGDVYFVPINMMDAANPAPPPSAKEGPKQPADETKSEREKYLSAMKEQFRGIFCGTWERVLRKEVRTIAHNWGAKRDSFAEWLDGFRDTQRTYARECLSDAVLAYCAGVEKFFPDLRGDPQAFFEDMIDEYVEGLGPPSPDPIPRANSGYWADRVLCYPSLAA